MAFTTSMQQGTTWTGLLSNVMPTVRTEVTDLMRTPTYMLPLYKHFGRVVSDQANREYLDLWVENEDSGLTPVSTGYETTTPTATDQPHGTPIADSYYLGSIQVSEIELMKAGSMVAIKDIVASRYYKKTVAIEKDFESDAIYGNNAANSLRMYGLEQLVPPFLHNGTTGTKTAAKWNFRRQASQSIQGVTRADWSSATAGGTGFESLSVDMEQANADLVDGEERFGLLSTNNPNSALLLLAHMDQLTTEGADTTDAWLMSLTPYEDLMNSQRALIRYSEKVDGSDGMFKFPKYRDKFIIGSESFKTSGLVGDGVATAGQELVIWGLNLSTLLLEFTENGFFRETDWMPVPMQPLAFYMAFFVAVKHRLVGRPDRNFCMYRYGYDAA